MTDLAVYLADHYGECALGARCRCLKPGNKWLGVTCVEWRSWKAQDWDGLRRCMAAKQTPLDARGIRPQNLPNW